MVNTFNIKHKNYWLKGSSYWSLLKVSIENSVNIFFNTGNDNDNEKLVLALDFLRHVFELSIFFAFQ